MRVFSIVAFIFSAQSLGAAFFFFFVTKNYDAVVAAALLAVFIIFAAIIFALGAIMFSRAVRNDQMGDTPVLSYDEENDVFICYDLNRGNQKIVIKNGNILDVGGSTMITGRELLIKFAYGKCYTRRTSIGFCRNIDFYKVKEEINKYHDPKI